MRLRYLLFMLLCVCVTPLVAHADCDYQRQAEISRLAGNVRLAYTYDNNSGFTVYMTNLSSELYATDSFGRVYNGGQEHVITSLSGNNDFYIYSRECFTEKILTKSIFLPSINSYSYYNDCKDYPGFKYCQKWGSFSISNEQFYSELNNYKKEIDEKINSKIKQSSILDIVLDILKTNLWMIIIFIVLFIILFISSRFIKNRR